MRVVSCVVTGVNNLRIGFVTAFSANNSAVVCEDNIGMFAGARHICNNKVNWFLSANKINDDIRSSQQGGDGSCRYRGSAERFSVY